MLNVYSYTAIQAAKSRHGSVVDDMYKKYSYEEYFLPYFKRLCVRHKVRKHAYLYQECLDAGMLAYMYSICRCSVMEDRDDTEHVKAYIWKIVKIYFTAAMVIADDSGNLCRENGFRQVKAGEDYRV